MENLEPINLAALIPLGAACMWAVRNVFGSRGMHDSLRQFLTRASWSLIFIGLIGSTSALFTLSVLPIWLVGVVVILMVVAKRREYDRRGLLWSLSLAAEKGLSLSLAARCFAYDRPNEVGSRTVTMADALDRGMPLDQALRTARLSLPIDATVAMNVGKYVQSMPQVMRRMLRREDDIDVILRRAFDRCCYVSFILFIALNVLAFTMIKIVPVFERIFEEFRLALPAPTKLLIEASRLFVMYYYLTAPIWPLVMLLLLLLLLNYLGWLPLDVPGFSRLAIRCDSSRLLRSLAIGLEHGKPIHATIGHLAESYPRTYFRWRLRRALGLVRQGAPWPRSLVEARVLRKTDAGLLEAAERAGNLGWALRETADGNLRRFSARLQAWLDVVFPLVILACGCGVLFVWIGLFTPLIAMIQGMS